MRRFVGLEPGEGAIPGETAVLDFRHVLEGHNLASAVLEAAKACCWRGGSVVDATTIHALTLAKGQAKQLDPGMGPAKKGSAWHVGMKAHIGVDANSGLAHMASITTAKGHGIRAVGELIRNDGRAAFRDKGCASDKMEQAARQAGVYWAVLGKAKRDRKPSAAQRKRNKKHASVRAKAERVFRVAKCQSSYRKTGYKGLAKNAGRRRICTKPGTHCWPRQDSCARAAQAPENRGLGGQPGQRGFPVPL
jgi:IS5 family transposase